MSEVRFRTLNPEHRLLSDASANSVVAVTDSHAYPNVLDLENASVSELSQAEGYTLYVNQFEDVRRHSDDKSTDSFHPLLPVDDRNESQEGKDPLRRNDISDQPRIGQHKGAMASESSSVDEQDLNSVNDFDRDLNHAARRPDTLGAINLTPARWAGPVVQWEEPLPRGLSRVWM